MSPSEAAAHSAVILDRRKPDQAIQIERLIADGVHVRDDTVTLDRFRTLVPRPPAAELAEPARWAYFAWRNTVVKILGPHLYERVRLDRNRLKITTDEQHRLRKLRVGVAGLSSGYSIALTLALDGLCGHLRLADFDNLELPNLNRIPLGLFDLGLNKSVAAARRIAELDPYLSVDVRPEGVTDENIDEFVSGLDIVIEQCDSFDMKVELRESARRHGVAVVMHTNDRGLLDVERFDLDPGRTLFHGLVDDLDLTPLRDLAAEQKTGLLLQIIDARMVSVRGAASLLELGRTVGQWPQIGSESQFGAALVAKVVRRIGLGLPMPSGRLRADPDELLDTLTEPPAPPALPEPVTPSDPDFTSDPRRTILQAASRAPSGGNSQPWRFHARESGLVIEPVASGSSMDIGGRGSFVAAGAAAFNSRVAAAARHVLGTWAVLTDGAVPRVEISLTPNASDPCLASLYEPMLRRVSNRNPGHRRVLGDVVVAELTRAAEAERAALHLVTDPERLARLGQVLGEADRIRYLTPELHRDMVSELRWPGRDRLDVGLDVRTLGLGPAAGLLHLVVKAEVMDVLRDLEGGTLFDDMTAARVAGASAMAVVTVHGDRAEDYVVGGMAVERVWITATAAELGVTPISPVFLYARSELDLSFLSAKNAGRLAELRRAMTSIIGIQESRTPVLILRLCHSPGPTIKSLRRPLSEVVISSQNTDGII